MTANSTAILGIKQNCRRSSMKKSKPSIRDVKETELLRDENSKISFMLSDLSPNELEIAAKASYAYMKHPLPPKRIQYARNMAKRYLESKKGNAELALEKMKNTLKFRKDFQIDDLITAFDGKENGRVHTATQLQKQLSSKKFYVQGYDTNGRSTLFFIPRLVNTHDNEWTLKEAIYSVERAIACSKAKDGTINAVIDFSGFSMSKHAPPMEIGKQFLTTLRSHYAGQIHRIFLTDTPFSFSMLWKMFSPFVGTNTRDKIKFINGARSKEKEFQLVYDVEQVPTWMLPGGKNNRSLDVNEYIYGLDFDQLFDKRG
jgi:CRAL/TRIO domain